MASSSETPDGFVNLSSSACFSASASASCRACLEASSASVSASFFMKSLAEGSSASGLVAMYRSVQQISQTGIVHRKVKLALTGKASLIYMNDQQLVGERNNKNMLIGTSPPSSEMDWPWHRNARQRAK